ncbi:hypothetical protein LIPSTDRAFT_140341 [Lipomyces starkeyi NRRL Y-11557]|uniref:Elongation factor 1 alpha-like protein n=1 Tax=Lipomyces starkeyi NRRL Y-11557 TaxID=675824 RepID=A0A1E3QGU1_LIPST|nr:hypothetical protein LIPSTDRAFT_140341 [Lipomyces starkeyi NRRL Y-11557]
MEDAVAQVKRILKDTAVTEAQVRDTVWNYYFEVDQSVKFLRDQLKKQENKKAPAAKRAAPSKAFRERSLFADTVTCRPGTDHCFSENLRLSTQPPSSISQQRISLGSSCRYGISVFDGIPWRLPMSMNTDITYCGRPPPRMGLLGGSSKLAALAKARAAKRQQEREQQQQQQQQQNQPMEDVQLAMPSMPSMPATVSPSGSSLVLDTGVLSSRSESGASVSKRLTSLLAERSRDRGRTSPRAISPEKQSYLRRTAVFSESIPSSFATSLCDSSFAPSTSSSATSPSSFPGGLHGDAGGKTHKGMSADEIWKLITNKPFFYLPVTERQAEEITKNFDKPSPDDIIKEAQATKGGTANAPASKKVQFQKGSNRAGLERDMKSLSIQEPTVKVAQPKQKINVVEKFTSSHRKAHINFVVVGHVDAGKSTLMGRLLYEVGAIDERTIQKYKRDANNIGKGSFAFAWVLDQSEEERERGVTMDVAMNSFESSKVAFTILDAPGHKDFVPNMIAGASEADFAVLVIDSSPNAFEAGFIQSGQTKEHALLVRSLGVQRIIVAVNKLDNAKWSEFRFDEVKETLLAFLSAAGFSESQTTFVPCSGLSGDNIVKRSTRPELSWYNDSSLLEELENLTIVERDIGAPLQLSVTDVFKGGNSSSAISITGRINAGNIQVGETVLAVPSNETATIKSITIADQQNDWAVAGDNVQIALSNIDIVHLRAGDILCTSSSPVRCAKTFSARIIVFHLRIPLIKGSNILIYRGRTTEAARISRLTAVVDKSTGKITKNKPRHLISGQTAIVELEVMGSSFPMETFKASKDLGRIVLRQDGITVAAGIVEEILSVKHDATRD